MRQSVYLFVLVTATFVLSCSYPDDNYSNAPYIGTYHMTSLLVPEPVDHDQDGDSSANFLTESECYHNATLEIKDDGVYLLRSGSVAITNGVSHCNEPTLTSGTWTASGHTLTLTQNSPGIDYGKTRILVWFPDNNSLVHEHHHSHYPVFDSQTGLYLWQPGKMTATYTLQ